MNLNSQSSKWGIGIVLTAITTCLVAWIFGDLFFHPNKYLLDGSGDAIKNYYTFAWHVKHDSSWLNFTGTNYPFGEHVGYTDGHPLFSLLFGHFDWVKNNPIGFINSWIIYSSIFTVIILYLLLLRIKTQPILSAIGAICIAALSPQVYRLTGHLSLSYSWIIPLYLLLLLGFFEKRKWYTLVIFNVAIFFIHPYLGMGLSIFSSLSIFGLIVHDWKKKNLNAKTWTAYALLSIFPPVFYMLFSKLTDTHQFRPSIAKGFLEYTSTPSSVFLPQHGPLVEHIPSSLYNSNATWEGFSYIGFGAMFIWIIGLGLLLYKKSKVKFPSWLLFFGAAAFLLLCFSFGWPFKWNLEKLLNKIPYIQQFRCPGRFAWYFYFVITVGAVYWLQQFIHWKKTIGYSLTLVFSVGMVWEGKALIESVRPKLGLELNYFDKKNLPESWKSEIRTVQNNSESTAIIPLPFFHYGSDFFSYQAPEKEKQKAFIIAYHSGKPLIASSNPRVSLMESRQQLDLFSIVGGRDSLLIPENWAVLITSIDTSALVPMEKLMWTKAKSTENESIRVLESNNWLGAKDRRPALHHLLNDTLIATSHPDWTWNATIDKGQYDVIDSIPGQLFSDKNMHYIEYSITCENVEGIPHLQLILEQKDPISNESKWISYETMNKTSGLNSNTYQALFEIKDCFIGGRVLLVSHHNEPKSINYTMNFWRLYSSKR